MYKTAKQTVPTKVDVACCYTSVIRNFQKIPTVGYINC